jgi:hypothetical protein
VYESWLLSRLRLTALAIALLGGMASGIDLLPSHHERVPCSIQAPLSISSPVAMVVQILRSGRLRAASVVAGFDLSVADGCLGQNCGARLGVGDSMSPPIAPVAGPLSKPAGLEVVEEPCRLGGVDAQQPGQVPLGQVLTAGDDPQRQVLPDADTQPAERLLQQPQADVRSLLEAVDEGVLRLAHDVTSTRPCSPSSSPPSRWFRAAAPSFGSAPPGTTPNTTHWASTSPR